ncbi:hypothetical protein LZ24_02462 [Desulfobotulus alkaliphilus]|uniref:DksA C4-type domain-containing protein n=1 Tax=Desulfobotulus alkaliphilus TaxID=622671 RepID=A0A562RJN2_9BACT|nr:hypothetical protein [Desulfobotulus alkaliphilus]TWI68626.1 hypothetical protein LZ24_02462 [Desulfobotulus alkaliphilus]
MGKVKEAMLAEQERAAEAYMYEQEIIGSEGRVSGYCKTCSHPLSKQDVEKKKCSMCASSEHKIV